MTTYFVFSDESGQYRQRPSARFCNRFPFYVRSSVIFDVDSWRSLRNGFLEMKTRHGLPRDREIKWSYLWSLKKHRDSFEEIPPAKPYHFLKDVPMQTLLQYITDSCRLMCQCDYCKMIFTVTENQRDCTFSNVSLYKMHLQELMQRIEMEIQASPNNLAVLFFDPIDDKVDRLLRDSYSRICADNDFIENYSHIKDSISFEFSEHSFGVQLADYAAGIFHGYLRGWEHSQELFDKYVYPLIRTSRTGKILGYGIREVPASKRVRDKLQAILARMSDIERFTEAVGETVGR